jgi:hypothetical protein
MLLDSAIERLFDLSVGITPLKEGAFHEKPHKLLLLLAAQFLASSKTSK